MRLALLVLLFCPVSAAQMPHGGVTGTSVGQWQHYQDTCAGCSQDTPPVCASASSCTTAILPTLSGTARMIYFANFNGVDNVHITAGRTCAISSGCTSGNQIDSCTLTSLANYIKNGTNSEYDACYISSGASGATFLTVTLSGTVSHTFEVGMEEAIPPANSTSSYDASSTFASASCGSCTGNSTSVSGSGKDFLFVAVDSTNPISGFNSPYLQNTPGNLYGLNITSAPAPTFTQSPSGIITFSTMTFKSTAGNFTVNPPAVFTLVNDNRSNSTGRNFFGSISCTPTCSALTLTSPLPSAGDLLVILNVNIVSGGPTISSIACGGGTCSGGSAFVVPSGAGTCKNSQSSNPSAVSCAYNLSAPSGITSVTPTMSASGTYSFMVFDISRNDAGSFALDVQNSSYNTTSQATPNGQALTITGNDVVFQNMWVNSTNLYNCSYYSRPAGNKDFGGGASLLNTGGMLLLNTNTAPTPICLASGASTKTLAAAIAFK